MHKSLLVMSLILLSKITMAGSLLNEHAVRKSIMDDSKNYLLNDSFDKLEATSNKFNDSRQRTPSGVWKLGFFYIGLAPNVKRGDLIDENEYWITLENKYNKWSASYPNSPAANIFYAEVLKQKAWYYRGSGYSNTVNQKQWNDFYKYLNQASSHLDQVKIFSSQDPSWYVAKLEIAKGLGWDDEKYNALLNEALRIHPYYYPIHFSAINKFAPKWRGTIDIMEKFANRSVNLTRDKEGSGMYARVYWYVSQSVYGNELFSKSLVSWDVMKNGIDDVLAQYPDQWNINNFAKFSCLAGDKEKTRSLISKINGSPVRSVWGRGDYFSRCRTWSFSTAKS